MPSLDKQRYCYPTQMSGLGPVKHLVCPNVMHFFWIMEWLDHFPGATVWAPPDATDILQRKLEEHTGTKLGKVFHKEMGDEGWPAELQLVGLGNWVVMVVERLTRVWNFFDSRCP